MEAKCENCAFARIGVGHYQGRCIRRKNQILRGSKCELFEDRDTALDEVELPKVTRPRRPRAGQDHPWRHKSVKVFFILSAIDIIAAAIQISSTFV